MLCVRKYCPHDDVDGMCNDSDDKRAVYIASLHKLIKVIEADHLANIYVRLLYMQKRYTNTHIRMYI